MNRSFYLIRVLLLGLFTAHVLATLHLQLSNATLYQTLASIKNAGYLVVPNQHILEEMQEFGPSFWGAFFITFSVGAALSLLTLAVVWIWDRLFFRKGWVLWAFFFICLVFLTAINFQGINPVASAYFIVIPIVVTLFAILWMPGRPRQDVWRHRLIHLIPVALLVLLWGYRMDDQFFVNFRDTVLLKSDLGTRINDFYYKYTLYPSQVITNLDQKLLKTCHLELKESDPMKAPIKKALFRNDYLLLEPGVPVDLHLTKDLNQLVFERDGRIVLRKRAGEFLSDPGGALKAFSSASDRNGFFRKFTYISLLVAMPVAAYMLLYGFFCLTIRLFVDIRTAAAVASICCFVSGSALVSPFYFNPPKKPPGGRSLTDAMISESLQERIAALKIIHDRRLEVAEFPSYPQMLNSPFIPERYWLARALGVSKSPRTYDDLLVLLDDPSTNVVCMALYALGHRGGRRAVERIIDRIDSSHDWYEQRYAYKALRALGWTQSESK